MKFYIRPVIANAIYNRLLALALVLSFPVVCAVLALTVVMRLAMQILTVSSAMLACVVTGNDPSNALKFVFSSFSK